MSATERGYTLLYPIELKNKEDALIEKIESITMRRIKGKHARQIRATDALPMLMDMIGASAGLPPSTVDLMDFEDILAAAEVGADFFGGKGLVERLSQQSRGTGGTS